MPEDLQDIKNTHEGRKFLEKFSLLSPPGELASNSAISICLHQISALAGLSKQVINAIRAAAFLLEEIEEQAINETVRDAFDSQIMEFTSYMKMLVDNVNTKIDVHLKTALEQITKAAEKVALHPTSTVKQPGHVSAPPSATYVTALINPPSHTLTQS
jgi:formate dehydrogenase maturation protein FdhE